MALEKLTRNANEGIDMAPGVHDDLVYVSTVPGNAEASTRATAPGVLWALDAETGERSWKFDTVPRTSGADTRRSTPAAASGTRPRSTTKGDVYIDVANPAPLPGHGASSRGARAARAEPATRTRSSSSNAATGKVIWHDQVLPHDVYDWDLHLPPILTDSAGGQQLVLAAGKMGYVYAFDARQRQARLEDGRSASTTATTTTTSSPLQGKLRPAAEAAADAPARASSAASRRRWRSPTARSTRRSSTSPTIFKTQDELRRSTRARHRRDGRARRRDGTVKWKHDVRRTPAYGAATVVNDLVFTTTFDGKLIALDRETGDVVWASSCPPARTRPSRSPATRS